MKYPQKLLDHFGLAWRGPARQRFGYKIWVPWVATYKKTPSPATWKSQPSFNTREWLRRMDTHEKIHALQMWEWGPFFFVWYLIYFTWFGVNWLTNGFNAWKAYRNVPYEIEAYENERQPGYLVERRPFAWTRYAFRKRYKYKGKRSNLPDR